MPPAGAPAPTTGAAPVSAPASAPVAPESPSQRKKLVIAPRTVDTPVGGRAERTYKPGKEDPFAGAAFVFYM